jgi:L-lactate dehydrogenase complex protein LldE
MKEQTSELPARRVALFVTCMVDTLYPHVGLAATNLLERNGVQVVFPEAQTCCGQPAFNAGYRREARSMASHFLEVFAPLLERREVDAIVAPSGSCVAMVRHFYRVLFENAEDEEEFRRAELVSNATYELTEYLVDVLGVERTDAQFGATCTYHPCCHLLRELGVDDQPRRLLAAVEGPVIADLPSADECCGFGGLFAVKNADLSTAMGRRKARNIEDSGADYVVVNDVSCMTHLNGILKREGRRCRAIHIAEVLDSREGAMREGTRDDR